MKFWSRPWWSGLFPRVSSVAQARRRSTGKLMALEQLESREMLTAFLVTSTADTTDAGTLRWAIEQANAHIGADSIVFDSSFDSAQTIVLGGTQLPTLTDTAGPTAISGPGAELLTISGNGLSRIFQFAAETNVSIDGLTITDGGTNITDEYPDYGVGGGILNYGQLTLTHVTLTANHVLYNGGSIYSSGTLIISDSTLSDSETDIAGGGYGGGIFNSGILIATRVAIRGNSAGYGGGIYSEQGTALLSYCVIAGNTATADYSSGGGIYYAGNQSSTLLLSYSTIADNSAEFNGGGLYLYGQATISSSTIDGNSAARGGGISNGFQLDLINSTLAGNSAEMGGAIYNWETLNVVSSTISGNTATNRGGGIYESPYDARVVLNNTIVAGNSTNSIADNIAGFYYLTWSRNNLLGPGSNGYYFDDYGGNIAVAADADLGLGPLSDNGGPTRTMLLLPGSPAIDAGKFPEDVYGYVDQRGVQRPLGVAMDIGAVESPYANGLSVVAENETLVTFIEFYDPYHYPLSYEITGGPDAALLALDPDSGKLTFLTAPDYDNPIDTDADNIYHLVVTITDANSHVTVVPWSVRVTNLYDPPIVTLSDEPATYQVGTPALQDSAASFQMEVQGAAYADSSLVISISENRDAKDVLKIVSQGSRPGQISLRKNTVLFGGVVIGTFQGGTKSSPNLVIHFNSAASETALNALVKQISFSTKNTHLPQAARTLQMQVLNLNGENSNVAIRRINIEGRPVGRGRQH